MFIAHKGNRNGTNPKWENHPDYVQEALDAGFCAEVDVWFQSNKWFFGHDAPKYQINDSFLNEPTLWLHAKHIGALQQLTIERQKLGEAMFPNFFFHEEDPYVLTSRGHIWVHPKSEMPTKNGILVKPEARVELRDYWYELSLDLDDAAGICSDFIELYARR